MARSKRDSEVIDWLMQGDVAIQWQTMRDVLAQPEAKWRAVRRRVAKEGWGRQLLDRRDPAGGMVSPRCLGVTMIPCRAGRSVGRQVGVAAWPPQGAGHATRPVSA